MHECNPMEEGKLLLSASINMRNKNISNCWELPLGQSATKPGILQTQGEAPWNAQRLVWIDVGDKKTPKWNKSKI